MRTFRKRIASLLSIVITAFLICTSALAQGTTSRVVGTVLDSNGAAVHEATVTLTNEATRAFFTTTTTSTGAYVFDSVQVGTYTVTVEKQGFKKSVSPGNHLAIGEPLTVNVTLEVGQVAETVELRGGAELVQTSTSGNFGTLVEQRLVEKLPIVLAALTSPESRRIIPPSLYGSLCDAPKVFPTFCCRISTVSCDGSAE